MTRPKSGDTFDVNTMLDNDAIARRLYVLRILIAGSNARGSQTRCAEILRVDQPRWNNFEKGYPLPRDMALRLLHYVPGLTLDWIYLGREGGLAPALQDELRKLLISTIGSDFLERTAASRSSKARK